MPFLQTDIAFTRSAVVLVAVLGLASYDLFQRARHTSTHYLFSCIFGTVLSLGLIKSVEAFLQPGVQDNPHVMALAILLLFLGWRSLFGPWESQTKAAILGTFLFWIIIRLFAGFAPQEQSVRLVAMGIALIPAAIWCLLFLQYHTERISKVLLMFFAGVLSTVPVLLYDALVRRGVEFQFFLFRVTPESFSRTSQAFVSGQLTADGVQTILFTGFLSFLLVGLIEEMSKYWVLTRGAKGMFSSIDEVMQLAIIVAIGFAFAENVINPVYFTSFVRDFFFAENGGDLWTFLSNVLGRSVLTSMVHIVSTGVLGYFLGLAIFAGPVLEDMHKRKRTYLVAAWIHRVLRIREISVFRVYMLALGMGCAILLHGMFNFLVSLPDLLPGHPQTVGELLQGSPGFLKGIPLLLFPSLFYVVGGFWLLTNLFLRKENMRERGHLVAVETFVPEEAQEENAGESIVPITVKS